MKIKDIKNFYNKTKITDPGGEIKDPPVAYRHAFFKAYPRLPSFPLPDVSKRENKSKKTLNQLRKNRKSTREFKKEPLSFKDLAIILRSNRILDLKRRPHKRTYPSGGARFPVETYLISFNFKGLVPGAYHYNIKENSLELLLKKNFRKKENKIVSFALHNPSAAIIFTSVISRQEVKYGYKAYPYSFIEAGHMAQNIEFTCTQEKIGCCCVGGFVDDLLIKTLDLTKYEIPLYVMGFGKMKKK